MPRVKTLNADGNPVERYEWPAQYVTPMDGMGEALRGWRRTAINDREEYLEYGKSCRAERREYAKFFSQCAAHHLRLQRACTLMLPWLGELDKNQKEERPFLWALDLDAELDEIASQVILQFG